MTKGRGRDSGSKGFELEKMGTFKYDELPSAGHAVVQRQRELLQYYRLAEHEMPKLTSKFARVKSAQPIFGQIDSSRAHLTRPPQIVWLARLCESV